VIHECVIKSEKSAHLGIYYASRHRVKDLAWWNRAAPTGNESASTMRRGARGREGRESSGDRCITDDVCVFFFSSPRLTLHRDRVHAGSR